MNTCEHTDGEKDTAVHFDGICPICQAEAKDQAYQERDRLVAALSKHYPASLERHQPEDDQWEDDWRWVVIIDLPTGQASWHIHDSELPLFEHLPQREGRQWDGHSTDEKYRRLAAITKPALEQTLRFLQEERKRWFNEHQMAAMLVARMHEAAVGEVTGPRRGVVEDIADLRALATKQEEQLNRILQPGERWVELRNAYKQADGEERWIIRHSAEFGLAEARLLEAIRDTLKEMVKK